MITLHAHIPDLNDGTSWYRGAGPLRAIEKEYKDQIKVTIFTAQSQVDWHHLADADVVFLQRPYSPKCLDFYAIGEMFGARAIADWDDCLGTLHRSNPAYPVYQDPKTKASTEFLYKNVAAAWAPTRYLADVIEQRGGRTDKVQVIPNSWPDMWFPKFSPPSESNVVYWRGGDSHWGEMVEFMPTIGNVARQCPLWSWTFHGAQMWLAYDYIEAGKIRQLPWMPTPLYFRSILEENPAVIAVPLQDTRFNRSKSNIAWMEGIAAGAITVCPDWEEWRKPGTFRYKSLKDFGEVLREAIATPRKRKAEMVKSGQQYVWENLRLSKQNEIRWETIKRIAAGDPKPQQPNQGGSGDPPKVAV